MLTEMAATVGWALALDLKYPTAAGAEFSIAGYRAQSVAFRSIECDRRGSKSSYLDAWHGLPSQASLASVSLSALLLE
jgi:hypothetical protein